MGLFDWIRRLFGKGPEQRFSGEGVCPYCGQDLRTPKAKQCFSCGADWHDPNRVMIRSEGNLRSSSTMRPRPQNSGSSSTFGTSGSFDTSTVDTSQPIPPPDRSLLEDESSPEYRSVPAPVPASGQSAQSNEKDSQKEGQKKRAEGSLDYLDPGQFAPLQADELRGLRGPGNLWQNPWFGRRDLIPPVEDERTLLVDRGMVAEGFITPEQLVEIHETGREMDSVRPDLLLARTLADQAVARSEAERQALKEQKKAEAAQRRQERAEQIAHRRATDIVYLGRGVSAGLADRTSDLAKLAAQGLPALSTPADVAAALELSISRLRWLAFHSEASRRSHYINFTIPKRSGGERVLSAPHRDMARCQEWILAQILAKLPTHPAAHGFVPGRSTVSGAAQHVGTDVLVNMDLEDFFPSVTFYRVQGLFKAVGYSPAVATILGLLCTECPRRPLRYSGTLYYAAVGPRCLPQGACTSPAISNQVARRLDARLAGLAEKLDWKYTRYADDLSFSAEGKAEELTAYLMSRVRHIASAEGFTVNENKTRVLYSNHAQVVTGLVVNDGVHVPRKTVRRLRAILHHAQFEGLEAQNRDDHTNFRGWVEGMIAYISMVQPERGAELRRSYEQLADSSRQ